MKEKRCQGFTFLELLIAVTIFSIVAVAIYSSFNVGIRAWRKTEESYKVRQEARHALDTIGRELRCAISFKLKNPEPPPENKDSFEGFSDEVSFWRTAKNGIFKITYALVKEDSETATEEERETKSLCRISQTYEQFVKDEKTESILVSGLSGFQLQYAFKNEEKIYWGGDWNKQGANIPLGVRVILYFPIGDEEKSVGFSETVLIPTGTIDKKE